MNNKALRWLYANWMKATPFLAVYTFVLVWLYVKDQNYALFLIWVQGIIYWVHEFEEYVCPGGFLKFFNNNTMRCIRDDYPMTDVGSFWINIPLVYIAMPFSAVLAHFFGLEWGIWTALFSVLNGLGHVGFWAIFGRKYNPGLCASLLLNIPFGIYAIHYFVTNLHFSATVYIASAVVGILAQASMMIYAFGVLLPRVKREGLVREKA